MLPSRVDLRCPSCGYDVSQTLADGIDVCPECGGAVSEDSCSRVVERLPDRWRKLAYVGLLAPSCLTFSFLGMQALGESVFGGLRRSEPWFALTGFVLGCLTLVVEWMLIERWLDPSITPEGAFKRAIGPAFAAILLNGIVLAVLLFSIGLALS